jgi:hypothetical protein
VSEFEVDEELDCRNNDGGNVVDDVPVDEEDNVTDVDDDWMDEVKSGEFLECAFEEPYDESIDDDDDAESG